MKIKFFLVLTLIIAIIGCNPKKEAQKEEIKSVTVQKVERKVVKNNLLFTGTVYPWEEAALAAQMASRVRKIYVKEGDYVKQGQLLVQMDDQQLTQIEIQFNDAKRDFERAEKLKAEGAISDQQYEKFKLAYETLKTNYEKILENTQLRAPFSGVITAKYLNDGELFLMAPAGGRSVPAILHLMNVSELKVKISVNELDAYKIKIGQKALVTSDFLPGEIFTGYVTRISPVVDPVSKKVELELRVPNRGNKIKANSFVRVEIDLGETKDLLIPTSAILADPLTGKNFVYVYQDGKARKKYVVKGKEVNDETVIKSGLNEGDQIIVEGQANLTDGEKVKLFKGL
ncbi:MAG: efflux RND transporter periplasmic adaptor subunit [Ignavibacteria bacterium]|nr:efflux RND transporter periplasmic adaptor subunit [Ignavibacteria bacterium]MDH7528896.1 efflux RND transporter periplasmic adaptor subunit [Ignavibacteria bacterium]NPV11364.1 efflux RND transporter periplasmic adaptor subunit [Ignavibacteria bacterium]